VNRDRFRTLAEAYGGDLARWPQALQDEAAVLAAADPQFAQAVLATEHALDLALETAPRAVASAGLFETIVAAAPALRPRRRWSFWAAPAGLGAALAACAVAGAIVGAELGLDTVHSREASAQAVADLDVSAVSEVG
jgi:hypothetical protein